MLVHSELYGIIVHTLKVVKLTVQQKSGLFSHVLLIYLISRLLLESIGILSLFYFPSARSVFPMRDLLYHKPVAPYAEIWARWDSEWYLLIADHGYDSHDYFKDMGGGRYLRSDAAKFFPLYPWLIRASSILTQNSVVAGILVSNLAAIIFLYYFYQLAQHLLGSENAAQAALFYVFFPTSFFLNAVYSEALFLACVVAGFYYLEKKRLFPAILASSLAVLSRPVGILALPILIWLAVTKIPERRVLAAGGMIAGCVLALGLYFLIVWRTFGDLAAVTQGTNYWRGQMRYPLYAIVRFFANPIAIHGQHNSLIDFSFALLHLLGLIFSFRRLPLPYCIYSLICIFFPLSSTLFSFSRLGLANFPLFLYLGSQLSGRWAFALQTLFAMLLAFFMAAFANWYWVG